MTPRASPAILALLLPLGAMACATGGSGPGVDSAEEVLMALGRTVFTQMSEPTCGSCHVLRDAGTEGTIGPDLDELRPEMQRVVTAVTGGVGVMRPQDHLTEQQIEAVAHYVAGAARRLD